MSWLDLQVRIEVSREQDPRFLMHPPQLCSSHVESVQASVAKFETSAWLVLHQTFLVELTLVARTATNLIGRKMALQRHLVGLKNWDQNASVESYSGKVTVEKLQWND